MAIQSGKGGAGIVGSSQSPIVSEWSRWITAPNKTGGDLLTELEAIRKPYTEGLYTTEVSRIFCSYNRKNLLEMFTFEMFWVLGKLPKSCHRIFLYALEQVPKG